MTEASILRELAVNSEKVLFLDELKPYLHSDVYWIRKQTLQAEKQLLANQLDTLSSLKQYLK